MKRLLLFFVALFLVACGHSPQAPTWTVSSVQADLQPHVRAIQESYKPGTALLSFACDKELTPGTSLYCLITTTNDGYIGLWSGTHNGGMTLDWNITCIDTCRYPDSVDVTVP